MTFVGHLIDLFIAFLNCFLNWRTWALLAVSAGIVTSRRGGWAHLRESAIWAWVFAAGIVVILAWGAAFWGTGNTWRASCLIGLFWLSTILALIFVVSAPGWRLARLGLGLPWLWLTLYATSWSALAIAGEIGGGP